ncbi:hypothetical protein BCEP27_10080 [Burkholderia cepacia]
MRRMMLAQRLGRLADLALAGQEHQHVAGAFAAQFVDRVDDRVHQVALRFARGLHAIAAARAFGIFHRRAILGHRPVAHLDRIQPPAHLDHGRGTLVGAEMAREAIGVDRRGRDDQLQVRPPRQDFLQVAEQEVDVQAALVRLVDDQRVVRLQQRIGLRLGEQDPVRHQLDGRARREIVGKAHLVADHLAERRAEFLGDPPAGRRCSQTARLRMADQARAAGAEAAAEIETDLRQLRGLARAGFAADDDNLMTGDRARDFVALARHRQAFGVRDRRDGVRCDDGARRPLAARWALARCLGCALRGRLARIAAPFVTARRARRVCRFARLLFLLLARWLALLLACVGRTIRVPGRRRIGPRRRGTFRNIRHGGAL